MFDIVLNALLRGPYIKTNIVLQAYFVFVVPFNEISDTKFTKLVKKSVFSENLFHSQFFEGCSGR